MSNYDKHAEFYVQFVDEKLNDEGNIFNLIVAKFGEILAPYLKGASICDIACGEGRLSRHLSRFGPKEIVGIDVSPNLLNVAVQRNSLPFLSYREDDAQLLRTFSDRSMDIIVSNLGITDIPDHCAMFTAVHRILKENGRFLFSLPHPCFETPFQMPDTPPVLFDENDMPNACVVRRYKTEGFWYSGGDGVRGQLGAHHRTLSTYINDLLATGFRIVGLYEPMREDGKPQGLYDEIPRFMFIEAQAV